MASSSSSKDTPKDRLADGEQEEELDLLEVVLARILSEGSFVDHDDGSNSQAIEKVVRDEATLQITALLNKEPEAGEKLREKIAEASSHDAAAISSSGLGRTEEDLVILDLVRAWSAGAHDNKEKEEKRISSCYHNTAVASRKKAPLGQEDVKARVRDVLDPLAKYLEKQSSALNNSDPMAKYLEKQSALNSKPSPANSPPDAVDSSTIGGTPLFVGEGKAAWLRIQHCKAEELEDMIVSSFEPPSGSKGSSGSAVPDVEEVEVSEDLEAAVPAAPRLQRREPRPGAYPVRGTGGGTTTRSARRGGTGIQEQQATNPDQPGAGLGAGLLAAATPVEEELADGEAHPIIPAHSDQGKRAEGNRRKIVVILLAVVAFTTIVGLLVGMVKKNRTEASGPLPTIAPSSGPPSEVPTSAPTNLLNHLLGDLPSYTLESLDNSSTPQWQAWRWLESHPDLAWMSEWRKKQLFVLSTFFFAMEGPHWIARIRDHWMDYSQDECFWWSSEYGDWKEDGTYQQIDRTLPSGELIHPCNEDGRMQNIGLNSLEIPGFLDPFIPPEIELLTDLRVIGLVDCGINASIDTFLPSQLFSLTNTMEYLILAHNELSGEFPTYLLTAMTDLLHLELGGNPLGGSIPTEVGLMKNLTGLFLGDNPMLTGTIPTQIALMASMELLTIEGSSGLRGTIPTQLGSMSQLTSLFLRENSGLTGPIPSELGTLPIVRNILLEMNKLNGTIPAQLGKLPSAEKVFLYKNGLSGTIPTELGLLSSTMIFLDLSGNRLTGTIPTTLGQLTSSTKLYVSDNGLSGTIPTEFGTWKNASSLYFWGNSLTGTICSQLGLLSTIKQFSFDENRLTGTIPSEFGLLSHMEKLFFHDNSLTGSIPTVFGEWVTNGSLLTLSLEKNNFVGTVPDGLCSLGPFDWNDWLGLSFDCSDQLCGCDSKCACSVAQPQGNNSSALNNSTFTYGDGGAG